jgi:hypothetical protein
MLRSPEVLGDLGQSSSGLTVSVERDIVVSLARTTSTPPNHRSAMSLQFLVDNFNTSVCTGSRDHQFALMGLASNSATTTALKPAYSLSAASRLVAAFSADSSTLFIDGHVLDTITGTTPILKHPEQAAGLLRSDPLDNALKQRRASIWLDTIEKFWELAKDTSGSISPQRQEELWRVLLSDR